MEGFSALAFLVDHSPLLSSVSADAAIAVTSYLLHVDWPRLVLHESQTSLMRGHVATGFQTTPPCPARRRTNQPTPHSPPLSHPFPARVQSPPFRVAENGELYSRAVQACRFLPVIVIFRAPL